MVDIQLANRRPLSAILTLVRIAKHQIAARQAHRHARCSIVAKQVNHTGHAELASNDWNRVILCPNRQLAPQLEIVGLTAVVKGEGHPPIEQNNGPLHRRNLHGNEVTV
jgi:hypothetical protein